MTNINERLDKIQEKIKEDKFIKGRGLGNEISFYIFDYHPRYELIVRDHIKSLKRIFSRERYNRKILEVDLYNMLLSLAKKQRIYDMIFDIEKNQGKDALFTALNNFVIPEIFLNEIENQITDHNVIFITAVGKMYNIVGFHIIIKYLHEVIYKL